MKYKLKRNLPFADAGTEIILHESRLDYPNITVERQDDGCLHVWCKAWQTYDAWIEEVKPREYWIEILADGFARVVDRPPYKKNPFEYIKVREVIE